jgi:LPXTG-site transpeptidase (sortase) family protein
MLWLISLAAMGASLAVYGEGWAWQIYLTRKFDQSIADGVVWKAPAVRPADAPRAGTAIRTAIWPYIGRVEIPRLGLSVILLDGVDSRTLRRGIGHIPGTSLPGEPGNTGIAGHRDTFFRSLVRIQANDQIVVSTLDGRYVYEVRSLQIVLPEDTDVLRDSEQEVLTLVTCYPFYFIGPAPKRFVVQAWRTE